MYVTRICTFWTQHGLCFTKCTHAGLTGSSNLGLIYALAILNSFHHVFYCRLLIYPRFWYWTSRQTRAFSTSVPPWSHATPVIQGISTLDCDENNLYHYTSGCWLWSEKEQLSRHYIMFSLIDFSRNAHSDRVMCPDIRQASSYKRLGSICECWKPSKGKIHLSHRKAPNKGNLPGAARAALNPPRCFLGRI